MSYDLIEHILAEEKKSGINALMHLEKSGSLRLNQTKDFVCNNLIMSSLVTDGYLYFEDSFENHYKVFKFDEFYSMAQIQFV